MLDSAGVLLGKSRIPARSIALPIEHGAWGFLFEPLLAGLLIAPSIASPFLALLMIGGFLARQPLKFVVGDFIQDKWLPRTAVAIKFVCYFGSIAAVGFLGSLFLAPQAAFIPLVIAAPAVIYLIFQDAARQTREVLPEVLAAFVLAASIASPMLAAGHAYPIAAALWATMLARLVPSVLYIRSRLRLEKRKAFSYLAPILAHLAALGVVIALYSYGLASVLVIGMSSFLLVRSVIGLSPLRQKLTAKQVGIREVIYGILYALSVVAGHYLGI